ncbi:MAG: elongation factor G [Armatimonadota bacterium]
MSPSTSDIRNVVLVGHRGCGKTSLVESMLYAAGATNRLGSVDEKTAVADFQPEERERQISISPALCNVTHRNTKINIIDTPGYGEFFAEVIPCIWVADAAVIVVDAAAGVEVHTHKVYETACDQDLPMLAVINKITGEHADYDASFNSIKEMLVDGEAVRLQLPVGQQQECSGVVDLLSMKMLEGSEGGGTWTEVPEELSDEVEAAREELVDAVAANDEELIEKYLEEGTLGQEDLTKGLATAVLNRQLVPVVLTDAVHSLGVAALLDFIVDGCPAPSEGHEWVGSASGDEEEEITRTCSTDEPFSAVVFKTMSDPYVGRISLIRVVSGEAVADTQVTNSTRKEREKLSGLAVVQGNEFSEVETMCAGDLGCVSKLETTLTGDTLCDQTDQVIFEMPALPEPMHAAALEIVSRGDEDKVSSGLSQLAEEDVGFKYGRDDETAETLVHGLGALHLEVLMDRLARHFDTQVELHAPKVPYRETITRSVSVRGRHKKQTGGRGQFGDVWIRVEPLPRDSGVEFVNEIKGASVPTQYIPAVEKGVRAALAEGHLANYPVVDIQVTLYDGSSHPVDSSDQAFQTAGQIAIRNAMEETTSIFIEPIMEVEVTAPEDLTGDMMSDLSGRRGRIEGSESLAGGLQIIRALVPMAEMRRYAADLRSISQGRASYTMQFARYEQVPAHLMDQIISASQAEEDE